MSETKHTPGPWRIKDDGETSKIADAANNTIASLSYVHLYGRRTAAEVNANMHLIAAAPDMLEALTALLMRLDDNPELSDLIGQIEIERARAAIAKAEGRS